ncbi:unnamed protein product [Diabrotica balteata]|uniref:Uncharacterized protein n=1 Tax=Diabrotica balteata TaxID=107213 RepID=A0A9P0E071_DIABA|nr:unnamed protein product [Diabrotica balteata]
MKVLAVIFVIISLTAAKITLDDISKAFKSCGATYGGSNDIRKLVVSPNPDIKTLGLQTLCINIKLGVTNENCDVDKTLTREVVMLFTGNKKTADKVDKRCTNRNGATSEDACFNYWRCARLIIDNENN